MLRATWPEATSIGLFRVGSRQELLHLIKDRCDTRSMITTTQLPIEKWQSYIGEGGHGGRC
ncbi:ATP-binding protein [Dyella sp. 2RAB6]|uniref:ATP-binding protein n=1 Tax=Dyella sp. 2RAB6 TaxID=3232992 RepID=UPI003F911B4A